MLLAKGHANEKGGSFCVVYIRRNRLCAMEVKYDENKLGRRVPLCYDNAIDAVSLLHSCP